MVQCDRFKIAYNYGVYNWIKADKDPRGLMKDLNIRLDLIGTDIESIFKNGSSDLNVIRIFAQICSVSYDVLLGE